MAMTSSTAQKLASGSTMRVFNFFASALVAFFMVPFVISSLGDRLYGFWVLVATFVGYYGLLDFGLSSAVTRHIAGAIGGGDSQEVNRIFNTAILLYSALGLVVLLVTGILAGAAHLICKTPGDAPLFSRIILILGVSTAISFPVRAFGGVLISQLRYDITSVLQLMTLILRTTLVILALVAGGKILSLAWVTFLSGIPEMALTVYFSKRNLPCLQLLPRKYWNRSAAKALFSYSSYTFIAQMGDLLRFNIDSLVITAFVSLVAVTHYNIAATMAQYFLNLMIAFMGVFQPLFSRQYAANDHEAIKRTLFFATRISLYVAGFVCFGLVAWGRPFIQRWMGLEYLDAYPCLVVLALAWLCDLGQIPSVNLLYGISKHRFYALSNSIEGACKVLLSVILVKYFGILGVALGTFFPMVISKLIVQPIYVCRASSLEYGKYIQIVAKTLVIVSLSLVMPLLLALKYAAPDYLSLGVLGLTSAICYSLIVWFFGFIPKERSIFRDAAVPRLLARSLQLLSARSKKVFSN